jgi:hypothetical protein
LDEEIRSPVEVAYRALALFAVVGLATGAERPDILEWLTEQNLWQELAPSEAAFVDTPNPSPQQKIDAGWLSERLVVLGWALALLDEMPPADEQCDTADFQEIFPPFAAISVPDFVAAAHLRSPVELTAMADEILDLHWQARNARRATVQSVRSRAPRQAVDLEIIQERHHAINWIIGYEGLAWDDVTTDT